MNSSFDVIEAARQLADHLAQSGDDTWAQRIRDAIDNASTGGELVMALRWTLGELVAAKPDLPGPLKQDVARILADIAGTGW